MDTLSDEMLLIIFESLPLRTVRETVKLVCKRWNEVSKFSTFTDREKINFFHGYNITSVAPYCDFHQRKVLHLHFHRQEICWNDAETDFWKSNGERVRSIYLKYCSLSFLDLKMIIEFCPNLRSIDLLYSKRKLFEDFDLFVQLDFIAPSVTKFQFTYPSFDYEQPSPYQITDKVLKILTMFPRLTDLTIRFPAHPRVSAHDLIMVLCSLDMVEQLRNLTLDVFSVPTTNFTPLLPHLKKIKTLRLLESPYSFVDNNIMQPFSALFKLTKITSLDLNLRGHSSQNILLCVLNSFACLRSLRFEKMSFLEIDEIVIQKLLSSKLEFLSLGFNWLMLHPIVKTFNDFYLNVTLETLSINGSYVRDNHRNSQDDNYSFLFFIFAKYFQNISNFSVFHWSTAILKHIFKYQTRLKRLGLYGDVSRSSNDEFPARVFVDAEGKIMYHISNLSNLQNLIISPARCIHTRTIANFCLPALTRIRLSHFKFLTTKMKSLKKSSPLLEELILRVEQRISQEQLETILPLFQHLRCVNIQEGIQGGIFQQLPIETCTIYNYRKFFEVCPTLRKFAHNNVWFHYNILTKELEAWQYPNAKDTI